MSLQSLYDYIAFQFTGGLLGELLERNRAVQIDLGMEQVLLVLGATIAAVIVDSLPKIT